ncbi:MAG: hypothetical protein ABFR75_10865 [Acidobacteriota bacterium]
MNFNKRGYTLIAAIIAINIFAIFSLMAASMWERVLGRDLEEELLFRGEQYVNAIENFRKKNPNLYPRSLEELDENKFLRELYKDPVSDSGEWNLVLKSKNARIKSLMVVPTDLLAKYIRNANLIGVSSSSINESYRIYRGKTRYDEWAFYIGAKKDKEMPELKFITD